MGPAYLWYKGYGPWCEEHTTLHHLVLSHITSYVLDLPLTTSRHGVETPEALPDPAIPGSPDLLEL